MSFYSKYVANDKLTEAARRMKQVKDQAIANKKRREGIVSDSSNNNAISVVSPNLSIPDNKG